MGAAEGRRGQRVVQPDGTGRFRADGGLYGGRQERVQRGRVQDRVHRAQAGGTVGRVQVAGGGGRVQQRAVRPVGLVPATVEGGTAAVQVSAAAVVPARLPGRIVVRRRGRQSDDVRRRRRGRSRGHRGAPVLRGRGGRRRGLARVLLLLHAVRVVAAGRRFGRRVPPVRPTGLCESRQSRSRIVPGRQRHRRRHHGHRRHGRPPLVAAAVVVRALRGVRVRNGHRAATATGAARVRRLQLLRLNGAGAFHPGERRWRSVSLPTTRAELFAFFVLCACTH